MRLDWLRQIPDRPGKPLTPAFWLVLAAAVLLAFLLRFAAHRSTPGVTYDEALYVGLSNQLRVHPPTYDPRRFLPELQRLYPTPSHPQYLQEPLFKHPPLYPWLISRMPPSLWAGKTVSVIAGGLAVLALGFLGARIMNPRAALLGACLLAIDPAHWTISTKMWMEATLALWMTCGTLAFIAGLKNEHWFPVSGVFCGLALLTKYTAAVTLLSILLFTLAARRDLLARRLFWSLPLLAGILFWPWIQWNVSVYGIGFFAKVLSLHGSAANQNFLRILAWAFAAFGLLLLVVAFSQILKKSSAAPSAGSLEKQKLSGIAILCLAAWAVAMVLLAVNPKFWQALGHSIDWNYLPPRRFLRFFYKEEDWAFGFRRLIELSPFYAVAFATAATLARKNRAEELNLILPATLLLAAFTVYREFETRYLVPVVPLLLLLAATGILRIWRTCRASRIGQIAFAVVMVLAAAKTFKVGMLFAIGPTVYF